MGCEVIILFNKTYSQLQISHSFKSYQQRIFPVLLTQDC